VGLAHHTKKKGTGWVALLGFGPLLESFLNVQRGREQDGNVVKKELSLHQGDQQGKRTLEQNLLIGGEVKL